MNKTKKSIIAVLMLFLPAISQASPLEEVALVIDASGSMWGKLGRTPKNTAVAHALEGLSKDLEEGSPASLTVFGHKSDDECNGGETIIATRPFKAAEFAAALTQIKPKGRAPLANTITSITNSIRQKNAAILLITDGADSCGEDPCKLLNTPGDKPRIFIIALDVRSKKELENLECVSKLTNAKLIAINDEDSLTSALRSTLKTLFLEGKEVPPPPPITATIVSEQPKIEETATEQPTETKATEQADQKLESPTKLESEIVLPKAEEITPE